MAEFLVAIKTIFKHEGRFVDDKTDPGGATDYARIEDDIKAWCDEFRVQEVAFDRALAPPMGQPTIAAPVNLGVQSDPYTR